MLICSWCESPFGKPELNLIGVILGNLFVIALATGFGMLGILSTNELA